MSGPELVGVCMSPPAVANGWGGGGGGGVRGGCTVPFARNDISAGYYNPKRFLPEVTLF